MDYTELMTDILAGIFLVAFAVVSILVFIYAIKYDSKQNELKREFYKLHTERENALIKEYECFTKPTLKEVLNKENKKGVNNENI